MQLVEAKRRVRPPPAGRDRQMDRSDQLDHRAPTLGDFPSLLPVSGATPQLVHPEKTWMRLSFVKEKEPNQPVPACVLGFLQTQKPLVHL